MDHETNRQVSEEEKQLWRAVKTALKATEAERISATQVAVDQVGIHETRSRQIVSTWENEGLVFSGQLGSYDQVALTEYGCQVDDIVSTHTSGESWR